MSCATCGHRNESGSEMREEQESGNPESACHVIA
jgi:hypothetical protein